MSVLIFEDSGVKNLAPITTSRLSCAITCASYRLIDLAAMLGQPLVGLVRPFLEQSTAADFPQMTLVDSPTLNRDQRPVLMLNGRVTPTIANLTVLKQLVADQVNLRDPQVIWDGDQIAAVVSPGWTWGQLQNAGFQGIDTLLAVCVDLPRSERSLDVLRFPHNLIQSHMDCINSSLEYRIAEHQYPQYQDGVFLAAGASLGEYIVCDSSKGPIIIDQDAVVGPYTLLRGPLYIGPKSKVLEHAAIKDAVCVGHTTKIGGEVEAAIVEPYSNKQHHGFLGHSYLGSWINLGAGTCNSDLKNTYGTVNMEYPSKKVATGMQFLGCVMGDYSKTAINTGIFTGKVIGVCSMMYGFVTNNVPSFVNYARLFGQTTTLPPDIMVATQQRMFSRRKVQQRPCDVQLLHDMFYLTQDERDRFTDGVSS